jgi:hypothetical protein
LVALEVAFELRKSGVTTSSLKKVVQFLHANAGIEKPLADARLVVSGRNVLVVGNEHELVSALARPGQSCLSFVVDLPRTLGELVEVANVTRAFAIGVSAPEPKSQRAKQPVSSSSGKPRRKQRAVICVSSRIKGSQFRRFRGNQSEEDSDPSHTTVLCRKQGRISRSGLYQSPKQG